MAQDSVAHRDPDPQHLRRAGRRRGWAQNPGKLYRVGMVLVRPPNLLPPNVPQPSFGADRLAARFWIGWPTTATFRERTSSSKRGSEDTSNWRNLQRS